MANTKPKQKTTKPKGVSKKEILAELGLPADASLEDVSQKVEALQQQAGNPRGTPVIYKDGRMGLRGLGVRVYHEELEEVVEAMSGLITLRAQELAKGPESRLVSRRTPRE